MLTQTHTKREKKRERERRDTHIETQREREPANGSLPTVIATSGSDKKPGGNSRLELPPSLTCGWEQPKYLVIFFCLPRCDSRMLHRK